MHTAAGFIRIFTHTHVKRIAGRCVCLFTELPHIISRSGYFYDSQGNDGLEKRIAHAIEFRDCFSAWQRAIVVAPIFETRHSVRHATCRGTFAMFLRLHPFFLSSCTRALSTMDAFIKRTTRFLNPRNTAGSFFARWRFIRSARDCAGCILQHNQFDCYVTVRRIINACEMYSHRAST